MEVITFLNPCKLVFGNGSIDKFADDFKSMRYERTLVVTAPPVVSLFENIVEKLTDSGVRVTIFDSIESEPSITDLKEALKLADNINADSIIGIGGGSVLDIAKLTAALHKSNQTLQEIIGIDKLRGRETYLACLPTTAGTGSEVSPNAILLDETDNLKKGTVSQYLVPDISYIDPLLTKTVPPKITASTGIDALTHCLEAYTNKFAHPIVDIYALEGIRLISGNLVTAYRHGENEQAREKVALGSLFGGLCLGPVNTAAVHALSYPLGGKFHTAHGLSNAILLPYVMRFNAKADIKKYSEVARALGSKVQDNSIEAAEDGVRIVFEMMEKMGIPTKLSEINIPKDAIDGMAKKAMTVKRLLKNNPRELNLDNARQIYLEAY